MEADLYPEVFGRPGIEVIKPGGADRAWLHERYLGELLEGTFTDSTREGVVAIIDRMVERDGIEAAVLAGTELPLLLNSPMAGGVPLLDTTQLHVEAIVQRLHSGERHGAT
jgi:aspartate racemase